MANAKHKLYAAMGTAVVAGAYSLDLERRDAAILPSLEIGPESNIGLRGGGA